VAAVATLAEDLVETMIKELGVGLAAPQVGESLRVFVTGVAKDYRIYLNPRLVEASEEQIDWEEGCLSLPRLLGVVRRPKQVTFEYQTLIGQTERIEADDLLARVLQHELDHLDGILFPDRMTDRSTLKQLTEEEWASRGDDKKPGESVSTPIE
jgi:peptide deformylase